MTLRLKSRTLFLGVEVAMADDEGFWVAVLQD